MVSRRAHGDTSGIHQNTSEYIRIHQDTVFIENLPKSHRKPTPTPKTVSTRGNGYICRRQLGGRVDKLTPALTTRVTDLTCLQCNLPLERIGSLGSKRIVTCTWREGSLCKITSLPRSFHLAGGASPSADASVHYALARHASFVLDFVLPVA